MDTDTRADGGVDIPEGLKILSPEEVTAREQATAPTATDAEVAAAIEAQKAQYAELIAAAEAQAKKIAEDLSGIGTYVLVRIENPVSLRSVMTFSDPRPEDRTLLAVFERYIRELKAYETRDYWKKADEVDENAKEEAVEKQVTTEILRRGLPNNRATRRKLAQEMGLL